MTVSGQGERSPMLRSQGPSRLTRRFPNSPLQESDDAYRQR